MKLWAMTALKESSRGRIDRLGRWLGEWRRYGALLVALFLARGLFVLSVLPPLEGWDEYQHVSYIVFLIENDRAPVLEEDAVPRSLYDELVRYPQSPLAVEQVGPIGVRTYEAFWSGSGAAALPEGLKPWTEAPRISLYQAQHGSLYYRLVAPVYSWAHQRGGLLAAVTVLRLVNLILGAGAIAAALWGIGRIVRPGRLRFLLGLLIAAQPLYLINCTRVANDALAVFLGTAVVSIVLVFARRRAVTTAIAAGILLGLGILAKTINLALVPPIVLAFFWRSARERAGWGRAVVSGGLVIACVGAICFSYFRFNLERFGMLTPLQEAVMNRERGRTAADYIATAREIHWADEISRRYLRHSLWRGGWSFIPPPRWLARVQEGLICAAALGPWFLLVGKRKRERLIFEGGFSLAVLVVLLASMTASLGYHMLQSKLALGSVATNIWYAAVCFPWMLCLFAQGLACWPWRIVGTIGATALLGVFILAELIGTLDLMPRAYAGEGWGALARERLAALHPSWLGPSVTVTALVVAIALVVATLTAVWRGCSFSEEFRSMEEGACKAR